MRKNYFLVILAIVFTMNAVAQNIPSYVPTNGLVGFWPFNGNANDESGNGNHGTVNGATLTADRSGKTNSAYSFDGNDYISSSPKNLAVGNNKRAISVWLNTSFTEAGGPLVEYGSSEILNRFGLLVLKNFKNYCYPFVACQFNDIDMNTSIKDSSWTHILVNYQTNEFEIYVNGKLEIKTANFNMYSTNDVSTINTPISDLLFGKSVGLEYFKGLIDDIAVFNRTLTDQEISALYTGCTNETATSSSFNSLLFTNGNAITVTAEPQGGVFTGTSIENNQFIPAKAKIGSNKVKYSYKNSQGCADSTVFNMVVADTVGTSCTKFDTVIVTNNVTKYDTVKVNTYDTITITNNVTKYDTLTVTNNVTKYDTVIVKTNVFDTVKVNKYDTITITNNVTKYDTITIKNIINDTVKVNKYDTITVTNNVTKYDTVIVNKTNYDTVSVLKIKFKLTTGLSANQLSSLSIYPNPTSDILHIETKDAKALEGYRYRILNALGKEVYNELVTQTTTEIPLKTLGAAGMYQFEVLDAKNVSIQSNKIVLY